MWTTGSVWRISHIFLSPWGHFSSKSSLYWIHTHTHTFPHWDLGFHILSLPLRPPFSFYQRDTACHQLISSSICLLSSYRAPDLARHPTWHRSASSPPNSCLVHKAPLQALRRGEWGRALMERCKEWTDTGTRVVHAAWGGQVKGWISTPLPYLFPECY